MKTFFLVLLLAARVASAGEVTVQFRITGLFQPDRIEDLRRQAGTLRGNEKESPGEVRLADVNYETAVATFAYDPDSKRFKGAKAEQVFERIGNLLQGATKNTFKIFPVSVLKPEQQKSERIAVAGLDCKGCAYGAYRVVAAIDGVERATVDFKEGRVTAWIDPTKTNRDALIAALKKARVEVVETDAAATNKSPKQ